MTMIMVYEKPDYDSECSYVRLEDIARVPDGKKLKRKAGGFVVVEDKHGEKHYMCQGDAQWLRYKYMDFSQPMPCCYRTRCGERWAHYVALGFCFDPERATSTYMTDGGTFLSCFDVALSYDGGKTYMYEGEAYTYADLPRQPW